MVSIIMFLERVNLHFLSISGDTSVSFIYEFMGRRALARKRSYCMNIKNDTLNEYGDIFGGRLFI